MIFGYKFQLSVICYLLTPSRVHKYNPQSFHPFHLEQSILPLVFFCHFLVCAFACFLAKLPFSPLLLLLQLHPNYLYVLPVLLSITKRCVGYFIWTSVAVLKRLSWNEDHEEISQAQWNEVSFWLNGTLCI